MKQLIAVSQKSKQNCMLCSILQFTGKFQLLTSFTSRLAPVNTKKLTLFYDDLLITPVELNKNNMLPLVGETVL